MTRSINIDGFPWLINRGTVMNRNEQHAKSLLEGRLNYTLRVTNIINILPTEIKSANQTRPLLLSNVSIPFRSNRLSSKLVPPNSTS